MFGFLKKPDDAPEKRSWLDRLKTGLKKTGSQLSGLFSGTIIDEGLFEELETALITADAGLDATAHLLQRLRARVREDRLETPQQLKEALIDEIAALLAPLEREVDTTSAKPFVIMVAGVNGAGKTTSIGKLAKFFQVEGKSVLLAAGDTFRAAAREQLAIWGERNRVEVIAQTGADSAAVIFDAIQAGRARRIDIVIADTAGRLPTQLHLMDELKKVKRVVAKAEAGAPHEVWLVIDANNGQNALQQVKAFDAALGLTGLIVTKLDGSAKGGVIAAIALEQARRAGEQARLPLLQFTLRRPEESKARLRPLSLLFIGVGEGLDDLRPFAARDFARALLA